MESSGYILFNMIKPFIFLIWPILKVRAEILVMFGCIFGKLKTPQFQDFLTFKHSTHLNARWFCFTTNLPFSYPAKLQDSFLRFLLSKYSLWNFVEMKIISMFLLPFQTLHQLWICWITIRVHHPEHHLIIWVPAIRRVPTIWKEDLHKGILNFLSLNFNIIRAGVNQN